MWGMLGGVYKYLYMYVRTLTNEFQTTHKPKPKQGQIMFQGKAFPQAKAHFETVLALHGATPTGGSSTTTGGAGGSSVKKVTTNSKLRVHPSHYLLVEMLPFLVNAWCVFVCFLRGDAVCVCVSPHENPTDPKPTHPTQTHFQPP